MNAKLCPGDLNEIQWQLLSLGSLSCFRSAWGFPIWSAAPCHMENLPPRPFWLPWSRQKPWKMPWNWAQHGPTISRKTIWKYHMSILRRESNEDVCIQQSNESNALGSPTALMQLSSVKWASEMLSSFSRSQLRAASARDWYSSWGPRMTTTDNHTAPRRPKIFREQLLILSFGRFNLSVVEKKSHD